MEKRLKVLPLLGVFAFGGLLGCATPATEHPEAHDPLNGPVVLTVHGMSCPLCASNLDEQIERIDGVTESRIDLDTGDVHVTMDADARVTRAMLADAVRRAGFTLKDVRPVGEEP